MHQVCVVPAAGGVGLSGRRDACFRPSIIADHQLLRPDIEQYRCQNRQVAVNGIKECTTGYHILRNG